VYKKENHSRINSKSRPRSDCDQNVDEKTKQWFCEKWRKCCGTRGNDAKKAEKDGDNFTHLRFHDLKA